MTRRFSEIKVILLPLVFGSLLLSSCASVPPVSSGSAALADLDRWVAEELVPYLQSKMVGHPRFSGEPVAIVKLSNTRVESRIDSLTERLRKDLENRLIKDGGIALQWQRAAEDTCPASVQANYFLGLEASVDQTEVIINVRMLDLRENSWVPQFALSYRGTADAPMQQLASRYIDDYWLQGSRVSPYSSADADLAAESLAKRFSCEVAKFSAEVNTYLHAASDSPPAYAKIQTLLGNYLQQQDNINLALSAASAEFTLRGEMVWVDQQLAQLWVKPSGEQDSRLPNSVHVYLQNPIGDSASSSLAGFADRQPGGAITGKPRSTAASRQFPRLCTCRPQPLPEQQTLGQRQGGTGRQRRFAVRCLFCIKVFALVRQLRLSGA